MLGTLQDKLIAGGLAVLLAFSLALNVSQAFKVRDLSSAARVYDKQINDPDTGYVARLAACKANAITLSGGIDRQNAAAAANAARGAAAVADATRSVAEAQVRTADAQRAAAAILDTPAKGETVCERVLDLDGRILESFE